MQLNIRNKLLLTLIILFCLLFIMTSNAFSQIADYKFYRISTDDGLSQNSIRSIIQDQQGFLWFGTGDGINRYDGYSFTPYKYVPGNTNSLSDNAVQTMYQDKEGIIWIGTYQGLTKFNPKTNNFTRYYAKNSNLSNNLVRVILQDSEGILWIGTENGLNEFNKETEEFKVYLNDPNNPKTLPNNNITTIFEDSKSYIWIGTSQGIGRFNKKTEEFTTYQYEEDNPRSLNYSKDFSSIKAIYEDIGGTIWVGTSGSSYYENKGGLHKFNEETEDFTIYQHNPDDPNSISSNSINEIYEDSLGRFWIGTTNGLNQFDRMNETFKTYKNDEGNLFSISGNNITQIYEDNSKNIWIGTANNGLNKLPKQKEFTNILLKNFTFDIFVEDEHEIEVFLWAGNSDSGLYKYSVRTGELKIYKHEENNPNSLSNNDIWAIIEDRDGYIWIGTSDGLNKFDKDKEIFTIYKKEENNPDSLVYNDINCLYEDSEGYIWIGTSEGINRLDKEKEEFKLFKLYNNTIWEIYEDSYKNIWMYTDEGFERYNIETDQFKHYFMKDNNLRREFYEDSYGTFWLNTYSQMYRYDRENDKFIEAKLSSEKIWTIYEDNNRTLWFGTESGLNKYDRENDKYIYYKHNDNDPNSLSHDSIMVIYEDSYNNFWIGTYSGGLNLFNKEEETFRHWTEKDGLSSNIVYGILEDGYHNLWISTKSGLSKVNIGRREFRAYDKDDGLEGDEFRQWEYYQTKRGVILFGSDWGFCTFEPDEIKNNPYQPPVELTSFKVFGKELNFEKPIYQIDKIELMWHENFFSFEFATLDFTRPKHNQYKYILEGFNKDWIFSGTGNYVSYSNLDGGTYKFRVKGANSDGMWNEEGMGVDLELIIHPPFWETWWFTSIWISAIVIIALSVYFVRMRIMRKIQQDLERKVAERTKELEEAFKEVHSLKVQQDGDYFLTSLLINPLLANEAINKDVKMEFYISQKKKFTFRKWHSELGGDLCISHTIKLYDKNYTVFVNGDAMGKSIQGAGGSLVLGVVFNAFVARTKHFTDARHMSPELWLIECFDELQSVFTSFDGSMLISVVMGIIDDETGMMYYFNAEHPWTVLYRDGKASFAENELLNRKIGTMIGMERIKLLTIHLKPHDVVIAGSDGRDDIMLGVDEKTGSRIINEDEKLFLDIVEESNAELSEIVKRIKEKGELTDDLSLLKITYKPDYDKSKEKPIPQKFYEMKAKGLESFKNRNFDNATKYLKKAVDIKEDSECYNKLVKSHIVLKRYTKALKTVEEALKFFPGDLNIIFQAALLYKRHQNFEQAIRYSNRYYMHDPENIRNLINLADTYRLMKDYEMAKNILNEAEKIDSNNENIIKLKKLVAV